jgi:drug/metabolite transporter (DMT)-like permease
MVTIFLWSIGPLFVKYFTRFYNPWTQNAFRYSCAALALVGWMAWKRRPIFRLSGRQWKNLLLVTACNVCMQVLFAAAYYFIYPAVASLIHRVSILFVIALSFLVFHDERQVIRSWRFLVGCVLTLAGALLVTLGQDPLLLARLEVSQSAFWIGVALALAYALFLALYTVTIKHLVRDVPPLISFTHVSWTTALALVILMLCMGGAPDLWRQPLKPLGVMVLSAVLCISVAHPALFAALRHVKAVVSSALMQLLPVLTCTGSALLFGDRLSTLQILGGGLVICGASLAAIAEARLKDEV